MATNIFLEILSAMEQNKFYYGGWYSAGGGALNAIVSHLVRSCSQEARSKMGVPDMKKVSTVMQLKLDVSIALLLSVCAATLIVIFGLCAQYRALLVFSSAVIGGMGAICSAFYIGRTLQITLEREQLHRSFEMLTVFSTIEFTKARTFVMKEINYKEQSPRQIYDKIVSDESLLHTVKFVLNHLENTSIAIQQGYVDEPTMYDAEQVVIPYFFEMLQPFVSEIRLVHGPAVFAEVEKLVHAWKLGNLLHSGQRINETGGKVA
jgi:hypothetical protein